ncbi:MAG: DUF3782 domain-containing protein [Verrucomicrobiota bacterium]
MLREITASLRETERMIKENAAESRETDRQMKETDRQMKEQRLETDREMKEQRLETDREMKETGRKIRELGKQIGGLGNKFGTFAEGLAFSSIERILRADFGMEAVTPRFSVVKGGEEQEYDVLAYSNGKTHKGMIVEVKSRLDLAAIEQMKAKMERLFYWMPEHRGKEFQGMVAYVDGNASARQAVLEQGWFLVHVGEDLFELKTPPDFIPKIYRAAAW